MTSALNPYLNFRGEARDALEFYQSVFGGQLTVTTFQEGGMPIDPDEQGLVMHGQLTTDSGFTLMGSDVPSSMGWQRGENQFSVSLSGDASDELTGYWDRLSDGATVLQPLEQAPWGDSFGMLQDRFGVPWLVNISGSATA